MNLHLDLSTWSVFWICIALVVASSNFLLFLWRLLKEIKEP